MASASQHAQTTISFVRKRSKEIVLFYSGGGKDSLILLDMLCKEFETVHCLFMYFVPNMRHQKPYLDYLKRYPNAKLYQYPHWSLADYFRNGEGTRTAYDTTKVRLADVEDHIRAVTGCEWICSGWKKSDSLTRRLVLNTYLYESISVATKKIYPLSQWNKADVLRYIKQHKLIKPITYNQLTNTTGLDLLPEVLIWLKANFADDYQKVCRQFPRAEAIVFAYEHQPK